MRRRGERGVVTAELAMGLPLLLALTVALVWVLSVGYAQIRLVDATREAARALARGDSEEQARRAAVRVAPEGASFAFGTADGLVTVQGRARVDDAGLAIRVAPSVRLRAEAIALAEEDR
ncbi:MAG: TadE family type IV pilus minor pilin [Nocardioides sp.]|jgi:Flp pilus assembly protein TadG